jgi:hypothetical protein
MSVTLNFIIAQTIVSSVCDIDIPPAGVKSETFVNIFNLLSRSVLMAYKKSVL